MPQLTCPPRKTLLGWADGELLPSDSESLESHVANCSKCQIELSEEDSADPIVRALQPVSFVDTSRDDDVTLNEAIQNVKRLVQAIPESARTFPGPDESVREHSDDRAEPEPLDFLDPPARPGSIGRLGRFHVFERLGSGGVGIVFKALDSDLGRTVALKVLKPAIAGDPTSRQRFLREARAAALVRHPNICAIHEVGEHAGRLFLAMELIDGGSLAQRLAGVPQPPRQAAQLVETLARAIHAAHEQGIIHRDLKPGNILLQGSGFGVQGSGPEPALASSSLNPEPRSLNPLISDFGLAKSLSDDVTQTKTGLILGTPSYMAPEQAGGKTREIGPAADIYALGAILYEMLTGRPPFRGETTLVTVQQVLADDPVPPRRLQPKLPRDLETICLKCLEKSPGKRFDTARALADDISHYLAGEPIQARPASAWEHGLKWAKRNPLKAAVATISTVAVLALAISSILVWKANLEATRQRDAAKTHAAAAEAERQRLERDFRNACGVVIHLAEDVAVDDPDQHPDPGEKRSDIAVRFFAMFLHPDSPDSVTRLETAIAYRYMADVYSINGKRDDAERCYRDAVAVLENLIDEFPLNHTYRLDQAVAYTLLGQELCDRGHEEKAADAFRRAKQRFEEALRIDRTDRGLNSLAWFLATCFQPQFRDPERAVELAAAAVSNNPGNSTGWQTLGEAHYRAGNYEAARAALEKAIAVRSGIHADDSEPQRAQTQITLAPDDSRDRFFLAMTYWHLGEMDKAVESYQRGVEYMGKRNQPVEVRWFRVEAAELLGLAK